MPVNGTVFDSEVKYEQWHDRWRRLLRDTFRRFRSLRKQIGKIQATEFITCDEKFRCANAKLIERPCPAKEGAELKVYKQIFDACNGSTSRIIELDAAQAKT